MSRIDISITEIESGKLIVNRSFCRSSHLSYFCEESEEIKLRNFADSIFLGVIITINNIDDFIKILEDVTYYLLKNKAATIASLEKEESFTKFIADLEDSLLFLQKIRKEYNLENFEIEIM